MDLLTFAAAFLAGTLTFLNPCVLPVLPIIFGAAANQNRFGPAALAAGLALSFTAVGLFVATISVSVGLDGGIFRSASAALLILFGGALALPTRLYRLQTVFSPISNWANRRADAQVGSGLAAQFGLGALLGAMWSPCVGPTLGAATVLAAQGDQLGSVAFAMMLFGLGAALPLLMLGTLFRPRLASLKAGLARAGTGGRTLMGGAMIIAGALVLTGLDKQLEILFLDHAPLWFTTLGTQL